jgi:hypothetical protein
LLRHISIVTSLSLTKPQRVREKKGGNASSVIELHLHPSSSAASSTAECIYRKKKKGKRKRMENPALLRPLIKSTNAYHLTIYGCMHALLCFLRNADAKGNTIGSKVKRGHYSSMVRIARSPLFP